MQAVHHLTLRNGLSVWVRPLDSNDAPHLVDLYDHLSSESRISRFHPSDFQVDRGTVWEQATQIVTIQPPDGLGLIAFADLPEHPHATIGAVRYRLSPPDEAEVSITIRDDMQSQGLGTRLIFLIRQYARECGIRKLFGLTRSDSRFMQQLLRRADLPLTIVPQGEYTYIAHTIESDLASS
jgi:RimJ/RimL family protein N-acetyltransferase